MGIGRGKQRCPALQIHPNVATELKPSGGEFSWRQVDDSSPSRGACIDGLLNGRAGILALDARGTIIHHVEDSFTTGMTATRSRTLRFTSTGSLATQLRSGAQGCN